MNILARVLICGCYAAFLSGCASTHCCITTSQESDKEVRYVIFGFGVVTIPKPKEKELVTATRMDALGIALSNQPGLTFGFGYSSSAVVLISSATDDVLVEVGSCTASGLSVSSTQLTKTKSLLKRD